MIDLLWFDNIFEIILILIFCQVQTHSYNMSVCTFFIKANDNPPNLEEIKTKISNGSIVEKIVAVK